jgi:hypothetical protein
MSSCAKRLLLAICFLRIAWSQGEGIDDLLERLAKNPEDVEAIRGLSGKSDPRIIAAFETAFDRTRDPDEKRTLAFNMASRGVGGEKYVSYLIELAKVAVEDDAPSYFSYSSEGKIVKSTVNQEFVIWCGDRGLELAECVRNHVSVGTGDVVNVAMLGDNRAEDVLRKGLGSPNISIAYASACGLGVLSKEDAVPAILKRIAALPEDAAKALAMSLALFATSSADIALQRYVPDAKQRQRLREESVWGTIANRRASQPLR